MSLSLCTSCFALSDLSKQSSQRCRCEEQIPVNLGMLDCPSGLHLCYICAGLLQVGLGGIRGMRVSHVGVLTQGCLSGWV